MGDEGGFAPNISTIEEGLDLIVLAIKNAGFSGRVKIAIDAAASEMYDKSSNKYILDFKASSEKRLSGEELLSLYKHICGKYPSKLSYLFFFFIVISIEDPFDQDDWDNWSAITSSIPIQIVSDDLTVSNIKRVSRAISLKAANCLLLKLNQIGTVSEAIDSYLTLTSYS